jgi:hypothetical protein
MHSTSSSLQFVQGAPCSVTLHLTFLARQHWQALDALLFTALCAPFKSMPAAVAFRFNPFGWETVAEFSVESDGEDERSDIV